MAPRTRSISRKALALGMAPALSVIVLVSAFLSLAGFVLARRSLASDMDALAAIVRDNVAASLAFDDPATAGEVIAPLRAKANVDGVCVFDDAGTLFASYAREGFTCPPQFRDALSPPGALVWVEPVFLGTRRVGDVELVANYSTVTEWMVIQGLVTLAALVCAIVLAWLLARRMQAAITTPILDLARVAHRVTATGDYRIRAAKTTDDEVGDLSDAVNSMLGQVEQHSRLKDDFLAALSHELRTPLSAIMGWIHILRRKPSDTETYDRAVDSVARNAQAQAKLVEDLLDVSRIVTGKLQVSREPVDLCELVTLVLDDLAPELARQGLQLSSQLSDRPCLVSADRQRLRQVLGNVLANAVKFTPAGGRISVSLTEVGREFVVTVTDTGVGMSPAFLPFVFDRFRQSDGSLSRERGGMGLGLAIAKDIVELHGGRISAASPGKDRGSTITVVVPRLTMIGTPGATSDARGSAPVRDLNGVRILGVDDDPDALELLAIMLREAGAAVEVVNSGREALALWKAGAFSVLICDISMPHMDGFDVMEGLHAVDPDLSARVMIALTAHADSGMRQRTIAAGFDAHVTKPYDAAPLIALIAQLLASKRQEVS